MSGRTRRSIASLVGALSLMLLWVPIASADHHLVKIREFSVGANDFGGLDTFLELQMYEAGQNVMATHHVKAWNSNATSIDDWTITGANPSNQQSQRTILLSDPTGIGDQTLTGGITGTFENFLENHAFGEGAVCFITTLDAMNTTDCVSWGGVAFMADGSLPSTAGTPISTGLVENTAFRRKITGGSCATALDAGDDTNQSSADFETVTPPGPTSNTATPAETLCTTGGGGGTGTAPGNPTSPINPAGNVRKRKCKKSNRAAAAKKKKCRKKKK